jgi:hypothetical protein
LACPEHSVTLQVRLGMHVWVFLVLLFTVGIFAAILVGLANSGGQEDSLAMPEHNGRRDLGSIVR